MQCILKGSYVQNVNHQLYHETQTQHSIWSYLEVQSEDPT